MGKQIVVRYPESFKELSQDVLSDVLRSVPLLLKTIAGVTIIDTKWMEVALEVTADVEEYYDSRRRYTEVSCMVFFRETQHVLAYFKTDLSELRKLATARRTRNTTKRRSTRRKSA